MALLIMFVVAVVWFKSIEKSLDKEIEEKIEQKKKQDAAFAASYPPLVNDEKGNSLCPKCNLPFQSGDEVYAHIRRWDLKQA